MKTTDSVRKGCCSILLRMLNRIQATETDISDAVLNKLNPTSRRSSRLTPQKTFSESDPQQSGLADCGDHRSVENRDRRTIAHSRRT
jgi:hypothetical protein